MYRIIAPEKSEVTVTLPSSKSLTHRLAILAGLNLGKTRINKFLDADDTRITLDALNSMGSIYDLKDDCLLFTSPIGVVKRDKIYLGNSGSSARFLIPLASFLDKAVNFYGEPRLHKRPFSELFHTLREQSIRIETQDNSLPARIYPGELRGGTIRFDSLPSSQIITAFMIAALWMQKDLLLQLPNKTPSLPYIKMTYGLMKRLGIDLDYSKNKIWVKAQKPNFNWNYKVEKDLSAASYWVIFALINELKIILPDITLPSLQGDARIFDLAEQIGAKIMLFHDRVEVVGTIKTGLIADCFDIPDLVPALSVLALFAPEPFKLMNVTHLQYKESDRIEAIQHNISVLGGKSEFKDGHLTVYPQKFYRGGVIKAFNDHRIVMSFAMAGTKIPNTVIEDPIPVKKSYPAFWDHFTSWEKIAHEKK